VKTIRLLVTALVRVAPYPALIVPRKAILRPVRAKIKEKREVAEGTLLVVFDLLGAEVDFRAGQYFWVTLLDPPYDDEKGPRRHISVVTSPNERGVLGLCTRLRDSAFKRSLAELPVGTEVDVEQPKGNFLLPEDTDRPYVFIAGGIGITVFRCMLRYIAEEQLPYRVTLIYSNRDRASSAFLDELAELEQNENLRVVLTMTDDPDWDGETRRIGADLLHDHLGSDLGSFEYLVAGPPPMVEGVEETLRTLGVPEELIHPDRFSGYKRGPTGCQAAEAVAMRRSVAKGLRTGAEPAGRRASGGALLGPGSEHHAVEREQQRGEHESGDEESLLHGASLDEAALLRLYGLPPLDGRATGGSSGGWSRLGAEVSWCETPPFIPARFALLR
jgi:Flavodoxin reductases (ferredoxin-NADPH reductases) family 1